MILIWHLFHYTSGWVSNFSVRLQIAMISTELVDKVLSCCFFVHCMWCVCILYPELRLIWLHTKRSFAHKIKRCAWFRTILDFTNQQKRDQPPYLYQHLTFPLHLDINSHIVYISLRKFTLSTVTSTPHSSVKKWHAPFSNQNQGQVIDPESSLGKTPWKSLANCSGSPIAPSGNCPPCEKKWNSGVPADERGNPGLGVWEWWGWSEKKGEWGVILNLET